MTSALLTSPLLTPRWRTLRHHEKQSRAMRDDHRFIVGACGRRSGKTEVLGKRKAVQRALAFTAHPDGNFLFCAPTRDQAKRLFWDDLKSLVPRNLIVGRPNESELTIRLVNGARLRVVGLDAFERAEGEAVDGCVIDEFAKTKPRAWFQSLRPALDTVDRLGWAIIIGRPAGRNHFWRMAAFAQDPANAAEWSYYHWCSDTVLPPETIAQARNDLDEMTFRQEYEADFLNFQGRAYYAYERTVHSERCLLDETYRPREPIYCLLDFNVAPGVAVVAQEHETYGTVCEGLVYVPNDSNTRIVCRRLAQDLSNHQGDVVFDGDATGGNRGSAKLNGSDWDVVEQELRPVWGERLIISVRASNPSERSRINAMNSRLRAADGSVRMRVCPTHCQRLIEDLEGVTLLEGGSGELDKARDKTLTHLSDALGYHVEHRFPVYAPAEFESEAM